MEDTKKKRTATAWLKEAEKEGHQWAAAARIKLYHPYAKKESLSDAISTGFIFSETPEGLNYWRGIVASLRSKGL